MGKKPDRDVSDARKEDLKTAWAENLVSATAVVRMGPTQGAFDAKALGTGGNHVMPLRAPGHAKAEGVSTRARQQQTTPEMVVSSERMHFKAKTPTGRATGGDKYHKTLLDGK